MVMRKYIAVASAAFARPATQLLTPLSSWCASSAVAADASRIQFTTRQFQLNHYVTCAMKSNAHRRPHHSRNQVAFGFSRTKNMQSSRLFVQPLQSWRFNGYHTIANEGAAAHQSKIFFSGHKAMKDIKSMRLFGSNPDSPYAKPGSIYLSDDRDDPYSPAINLAALERTIETTREIIGYPTFDVSLMLVDDEYMQEVNAESRGVNAPTDVLSFCFQENFEKPGVLGKVQFDISEYYSLGDMLIDIDYVKRKCEEDRKAHLEEEEENRKSNKEHGMVEGEVMSGGNESNQSVQSDEEIENEGEDSDDEYEWIEVEVDEYDDRGIAPAMQKIFDPEIRCHMLIVHGMLHLVGYDHIEDDDYELMVVREDEVLVELKRRLGDNFGVALSLPEGEVKR